MSATFVARVGGVLSADIAVPEHERELRFYSRVLSTGDPPLWREDLMNNQGMPIVGLGARSPEFAHLPLQWMPHIQVADVAASVECALGLGGLELMHGKDGDGRSQWAVLRDPNGAAFGVIPVLAAEAIPPDQSEATLMGRISWLSLSVPDAPAVRDFYRQVVGWSVQDFEMADGSAAHVDYIMLGDDGSPAAGICHARGENQGLPPVWLIRLPVGDLAETLRLVEEEGGEVIRVARTEEGEVTKAVVQDPVGAYLELAEHGLLSGGEW